MDSHVFGDNHGSKTNDSYSERTFQPIDTAKAEYLTFWVAYCIYLSTEKLMALPALWICEISSESTQGLKHESRDRM